MGVRVSCSTEKMTKIAGPLEYGAGDATPAEKIGRLSCTAMDLDLEELRECDGAECRESCGVAGLLADEETVGTMWLCNIVSMLIHAKHFAKVAQSRSPSILHHAIHENALWNQSYPPRARGEWDCRYVPRPPTVYSSISLVLAVWQSAATRNPFV